MAVGIYKITSPSGRVYIGQSWDIKHRWFAYRGSMSKGQPKLHRSFLKYGARNHEYAIIHQLPPDISQCVLDSYEKFYIESYKEAGIALLNLKEGGMGGKHCKETKDKISASQKGIRVANSGSFKKGEPLPRSESHCKKISKSLTGKTQNIETRLKLRNANLGKKQTKETIEKRKATVLLNKKFTMSPEHKEKLRQANIGNQRFLLRKTRNVKRDTN
jgi:group I intron endonuclease